MQMVGNAQEKTKRSFVQEETDRGAWLLDNIHKAEMFEKYKHDDDNDNDNDASLTWIVI